MLALTESAVQAVKGIVSSSEETADTGGLRVVADHAGPQVNFQLSVTARGVQELDGHAAASSYS